jgi:acetoin utilization deacetylase AcuC-like enzyme
VSLALFTHPVCLRHDPGAGHPEAPARLAAVLESLDAAFHYLPWREAPRASREQLALAHAPALLAAVLDQPVQGRRQVDADTAMSADSAEAARRAVGAVCAAVDAVMQGQARRAFCAVRPPGHHATRGEAMGFCLFNSVAVGALWAQHHHGLRRVAVIDFDVHHGNGTQDILWNVPGTLYLSSHQAALYPGSGTREETGGAGRCRNLPLPAGCDSRCFREAWRAALLPELEAFRPQLLLVSAGFDAHRLDPLAALDLETPDYQWLTLELVDIAERHAAGRLVSALEGGYSLTALRQCSVAHVGALA